MFPLLIILVIDTIMNFFYCQRFVHISINHILEGNFKGHRQNVVLGFSILNSPTEYTQCYTDITLNIL